NKNFVDLMLPDNSIDMVIGNVPFGEEIFDPHYPKLKARIHDYFIVKSLDKLRPGGVAALISSTGTLDKPNERLREVMANKADLVFALRFPATTFEKTAGTHVTTDLLIFQKRAPGVESEGEPFTKVVPVEAPHEQDAEWRKTISMSISTSIQRTCSGNCQSPAECTARMIWCFNQIKTLRSRIS